MNAERKERFENAMKKLNWLHQAFKKTGYEDISNLEIEVFRQNLGVLYDSLFFSSYTEENAERGVSEPVPATQVEEKESAVEEEEREEKTVQNDVDNVLEQEETPKPPKYEGSVHQEQENWPSFGEVIDLNRSFVYIGELFGGDKAAYNTFLATLDKTVSEQEADEVIHEYKERLNWDAESKAWELLLRSVTKRFTPGFGNY